MLLHNKRSWLVSATAMITALSVFLGGCSMGVQEETVSKKRKPKATQGQDGDDTSQPTAPSSGSTGSTGNTGNTGTPSGKPDKRTILIYIVGSDLESRAGMASDDIEEMLDADIDDDEVEILLCAGGAGAWENTTVSEDETSYYQVTDRRITKVQRCPQNNMGLSDTLTEFLNWGVTNYPADAYSLFFWNHGGGPMVGYGVDELSGDLLTLEELETALKNSPFHANNKLELLGFDACLMGTVETAWVFRDYAQYFVASQEVEPGYGWYYEFLSELSDCDDGGEMGKAIIDAYFDFYSEVVSLYPDMETDMTLSCVDLSRVGEVEDAMNRLFAAVNQDVLAGQVGNASRCRNRTKAFGKSDSGSLDLVDLKHLASLLSAQYSQASDLEDAVSDAVVYAKTNVRNANGLSVYHPYDNMRNTGDALETYRGFSFAEKYFDYVDSFISEMNGGSQTQSSYNGFSRTMGTAQGNGQGYDLSILLTQEQMQTFSSARYYVFWEMPASATFSGETEYLQVFSGQDVTLSDSGLLTASYAGKAVFGKDPATGEYSACPLSMYQVYDGGMEEKYYFPCMFWYFGEEFEMEVEPVNWWMRVKDGVPTLLNAYRMQSIHSGIPDKEQLNPQDYDLYTFANNSYMVATNSQGNTVFEFSGSSYGFEYERESGLELEFRDLPDTTQYRAVFLIEDIYSNQYFSDFIPLT